MKKIIPLFCLTLILSKNIFAQHNYPFTKKVNQVDTVFKHILYDPYRWIENIKSEEVKEWFKAEQKFTDSSLAGLNGVDSFISQLNTYNTSDTWWRFPKFKAGNRYYYFKGGRNQLNQTIYYRNENDAAEHLIFDTWQIKPGVRYQLAGFKISPDNHYLTVALDVNGEEYPQIKIYDTQTDSWLMDSIPHCNEWTIDWAANSQGFIYGMNTSEDRFAPENINKEVIKYHRLNSSYINDLVILDSNSRNKAEPKISDSYNAYIFTADSKTKLYCQPNQGFEFEYTNMYYTNSTDMSATDYTWEQLYSKKDSVNMFSGMPFLETDAGYYFLSNKGNGFKSLRKASLNNPDFSHAKIIIPEDENWQLENIQQSKSYIIAAYSKYGFLNKIIAVDKKTDEVIPLKSIEEYDRYNVVSIGKETDECIFEILALNRPPRRFILNIKKDTIINDEFWAVQNQTLLPGWENIVSEVVEVPSYDGTLVPLSIIHNKDTKLDGNNICFLYGYGAYGMEVKDNTYNEYAPPYILLLQRGVILAHAYVRGGGEKGESWHIAGMKENKPNSWKDFIACAEYLIKNKYTQPAKLACSGASAGGILIGRAITERPDLFAATHIQSGNLNNSRSSAYANGVFNYGEYGDPNIEAEFNGLTEQDATLHVKPGVKYPAVYITTGINDSRVYPWIPAKFAATMQANSISGKPVLLHTNFEGGHFGDANAESFISMLKTQLMAEFFMLWQCGHKDFQKK